MEGEILLNYDVLEQLPPGEIIKLCNVSKSYRQKCLSDETIRFILQKRLLDGLEYMITVTKARKTLYAEKYDIRQPKDIDVFYVKIFKLNPMDSSDAYEYVTFEYRGKDELSNKLDYLQYALKWGELPKSFIGGVLGAKGKYDDKTNSIVFEQNKYLNRMDYDDYRKIPKEKRNEKIKLSIPFALFFELLVIMNEEYKSFTLYAYKDNTVLYVEDDDFNVLQF
jgi:hypothetical protein